MLQLFSVREVFGSLLFWRLRTTWSDRGWTFIRGWLERGFEQVKFIDGDWPLWSKWKGKRNARRLFPNRLRHCEVEVVLKKPHLVNLRPVGVRRRGLETRNGFK